MAKVTLNKMVPKDSPIYAQSLQIGGLRATSRVKPVKPFMQYDPLSKEAIFKLKPTNKSK